MPVTALDVHSRSLVLDGRPFGAAGAYEKFAGTLHFAVDPAHPLHAGITDLKLAPRGSDGRVEFQSAIYFCFSIFKVSLNGEQDAAPMVRFD